MNSVTLKYFNSNLECQYQKEVDKQRLLKFTRLMLFKNTLMAIFQIYQMIIAEQSRNFIIFSISFFLVFLILLLKRKQSCFLIYVLIIDYLGVIVYYVEMLRFYLFDQNDVNFIHSFVLLIPFQILQSLLIYIKVKWIKVSLFFLLSLFYLYMRIVGASTDASSYLIARNFCGSWILHSFMAYEQEKNYKIFYKNMVDSFEKVNYFKLVLKNIIPSPIFIIDYEHNEIKFINNSASNLINSKKIKNTERILNFQDFEKFIQHLSILEENPEELSNFDQNKENLTLTIKKYYDDISKLPFQNMKNNEKDEWELENHFQIINVWCQSRCEYQSTTENILSPTMKNTVNSEKHYFEIKIMKVFWENNVCLFLVFNDNTNVFRISELMNLDKYKNQLLASVSHDLRTPLNGLNGMIELSITKNKDQELTYYLNLAHKSVFFLNYLVNDILDFSLMSYKKMRLNIEEVNLEKIIGFIIRIIELNAKEKSIEIIFDNLCNNLPRIQSDATRIKQILVNLLSNAVKFTSSGSIHIILEEQKYDAEDFLYKISVKDTGIGIKEEDLNKLYKLFGRLEDPNENNKTGIGLGLTISKKISTLLCPIRPEGLQVETIYGKGTTFYFFLSSLNKNDGLSFSNKIDKIEEKKEEEQDIFEEKHHKFPTESFSAHFIPETQTFFKKNDQIYSKKILVVDDDLLNILVAEQYLKMFGIMTLRAVNGLIAYKAVKEDIKSGKEEIGLVIMDCNMPIMDGFKASLKIKEYCLKKKKQKIPILAVTANITAVNLLKGKNSGIEAFLEKPVKKQELKNTIEEILTIKIRSEDFIL